MILNYYYSSSSFGYLRVFFFPRLTYNLVFVFRLSYSLRLSHQYLIGERYRGNFFVSHTNVLLGRGVEGTSSYLNKVLVAQTLRARVLAYKREIKVKLYCRKVLRW